MYALQKMLADKRFRWFISELSYSFYTVGGGGGKNGLRYSDHGIAGSVPARRAGGTFPPTRQGYSYQPHAPF